jgi:hypothetical protein
MSGGTYSATYIEGHPNFLKKETVKIYLAPNELKIAPFAIKIKYNDIKENEIIKGLFGSIALPLEPTTERFEEMLKADPNLEKEISTMGLVNDILHLQETKELRNLSLINDKQFQEITSAYIEYWRAILKVER